jgi:uncharacterized protein YdeI (YjbR/CyaY-like superfamily)
VPAPKPELPLVDPRTAAAWEAWLEEHHEDTPEGVRLRLFRKGVPEADLTYPEAVEIALCFGRIDGHVKRIDDTSRAQRFTPRRPRSSWSDSNRERVERLLAEGRMRRAGLREVEAAKADGRW